MAKTPARNENTTPLGRETREEASVTIVDPWPLLRLVNDDECWERLTEGDLAILGIESRQEWERRGLGNPCNDPRLKR